MIHTFIHQFGRFKATATLAVDPEPHIDVGWEPHIPLPPELRQLRGEYLNWMLDNYRVLAKESGQKIGYSLPGTTGSVDAWMISPNGDVELIMKNGKTLKPKR